MAEVVETVRALGHDVEGVATLAGDASTRRYFRLTLAGGATVIACEYPPELAGQAERDWQVTSWGLRHGLPLPALRGRAGLVVLVEDLGDRDLEGAAADPGARLLSPALDCLAAFQRCPLDGLPNPPFDAAFFRRELRVFEEFAVGPGSPGSGEISSFCDRLAQAVAGHPYRLAHRDFHCNNLYLRGGRVWAIDAQDMRGGPDTYDLASLLRERGGLPLADDATAVGFAAEALGWASGWEARYRECSAQRGLKVVGTFLRLAAGGRLSYRKWLPGAARMAREAVTALDGPGALTDVLAGIVTGAAEGSSAAGL